MNILKKIIGAFCAILSIVLLTSIPDNHGFINIIVLLLLSILFIFISIKLFKPKTTINEKIKKEKPKPMIEGTHVVGLPLIEGAKCNLTLDDEDIIISSNNNSFKVNYKKITDICTRTSEEIQKQYVSSVGGAIGGAVVFGPLGAIVGGRAKKKKIKTKEHYLIITYKKDDTLDYISFQISSSFLVEGSIAQIKHRLCQVDSMIEL